jgi:hypothetical protein
MHVFGIGEGHSGGDGVRNRVGLAPEGTMAWQVGSVHEHPDFIGFNIIEATSQRPIVSFSYSSRDEAANAHVPVAKALEHAKHVGVVPPRP